MSRDAHRPSRAGRRAVPTVSRSLLRDAVFTRLLVAILSGEYRRGQRLRLDEIAADMRVSRTPVREALVPLEAMQLVDVQRYIGVVIADWTIEHMVERLRILRNMVRQVERPVPSEHVPLVPSVSVDASDGGGACAVAEWVLRAGGCPVAADWAATMRPLLDQVFVAEIAVVHGIDVTTDRRRRAALLESAWARVEAGDVVGARDACGTLLDRLADLPGRFRVASAGPV